MGELCFFDFERRGVHAIFGLLPCVLAFAAYALSFPELTGRVVDDAGILEPSTKAASASSPSSRPRPQGSLSWSRSSRSRALRSRITVTSSGVIGRSDKKRRI